MAMMKSIEERELAKDFGFDVTAPTGGVQTSAASNREHKTQCRKIYSEFLINMRDYMHQEEKIKQELVKMRQQANTSAWKANRDVNSSFSTCRSCSSRRNSVHSVYGQGHFVEDARTKPGRIKLNKPRPMTVAGTLRSASRTENHVNDTLPDIASSLTKSSSSYKQCGQKTSPRVPVPSLKDHNAIIENNSDFACSRVIKMNPHAFSKLVCGKANVNVLNRSNGYLLKPVSEERISALMPKHVEKTSIPERLAIVRENTNFQSPTLSRDLKVNNLVAIKKSLVGDISPRLTVCDVMTNAKERRSRLYRILLTPDVIESSKLKAQKNPNNDYFSGEKTPYSKTDSARLTRSNLAQFEQDIQKRASEKLRKTVVDMVSSVANRQNHDDKECPSNEEHDSCFADDPFMSSLRSPGKDGYCEKESSRKTPLLSSNYNQRRSRVESDETQTDEDLVDESPGRDDQYSFENTPRRIQLEVNNCLGPNSNSITDFRRASRVSYHETTKLEPPSESKELTALRMRLRSETSLRPSTIMSGTVSQPCSPRVTHQDTKLLVRRSKEEDDERDLEMNRWRQRMIFVVGKKEVHK